MRIIAIAKSPAADISCVGISFIPAGARLSSGNTTPNTESVGLPSIWVLAAVTVGGNIMGIVGMLVFIPLLSVFYTIFREFVYLHLKKKQIKQVTKTEIEEDTAEEMVNSEIPEVK
mgnify:CR=1 FL=1